MLSAVDRLEALDPDGDLPSDQRSWGALATGYLSRRVTSAPLRAHTADFDQWLEGTVEQAQMLLKLAPGQVFDAGPAPAAPPKELKPKAECAKPKEPPAQPTLF